MIGKTQNLNAAYVAETTNSNQQKAQQNFVAITEVDDWLTDLFAPETEQEIWGTIESMAQSNLFLLLDRDLAPEAVAFMAKLLPLEMFACITTDTVFEDTWSSAPIIVPLGDDMKAESVAAIVDYYQQKLVPKNAAVLFSASKETELSEIQQHMASLLTASLSNARVWFRWWEPRTLRGLTAAVKQKRLSAILGPITSLCWYENSGKYSSWYTLQDIEGDGKSQLEVGWFTFSHAEESKLKAYEEQRFHASLQDSFNQHLSEEGRRRGVEAIAVFADYLTEARAHYIQTEVSIKSWFSLCERHGMEATKEGLKAEINQFLTSNPKLEKPEIIEEIEQLLYLTKLKL